MQRRAFIIIALIAAGLTATSALAWNLLFSVPEPSGEVTAIPVAAGNQLGSEPTASVEAISAATQEISVEAAAAAEGQRTYTIVQEESEVRFIIGEILFGEPKTVIGTNQEFAAQILVDFDNPQNSAVGVVQINARSFATDNGTRDGAINNRILNSATFEFITFVPSSYIGLPAEGAVGDNFEFQVVGDLTIRDITTEVTFDVVFTLVSADRIEGSVNGNIAREAYDLQIPNVSQVAGVDEIVRLEMDFVALAD
jgi:polyisoprenoid-binding protein YceI